MGSQPQHSPTTLICGYGSRSRCACPGRRGWGCLDLTPVRRPTGRSSIPETAAVEPRSRGVLDAPHEAGRDSGRGMCIRILRGMVYPSVFIFVVLDSRGSRECRVRAAPAVSCARLCKESAHEHTGSAEAIRHSLRNGFTAYAVLSPATNSSCHRRWRIKADQARSESTSPPLNLAPATGVGTTRFCRTQPAPFVRAAPRSLTSRSSPCDCRLRRRCRVHRIPTRVRDDARPPLCGWDRSRILLIWVWRQVYFGKTEITAGAREPSGRRVSFRRARAVIPERDEPAPRAALVVSAA